ncbi:MAG: hypothetical protein WBG62_00065, partial [Cyclobacteriaceae bacterium]
MLRINLLRLMIGMLLLIPFSTHAQFWDFTFLRVDNINEGYSKLKLGNNPDSFWTGANVIAGDNTHLTMTFRIPEGTPDYSKIQIRPNGNSASPVSLAAYLPTDFHTGYDWYTIDIPLADFNSAIDFTNLYLIQVPYSADAGDFVFDLKRIEFTGGSVPYVWYGHENRGNIQDGNGYTGQMVAYEQSDLYMTANFSYSKNNPPYNGTASLIATYKDRYDQEAFASLWRWDDGYTGRYREGLNPRTYEVVFGPVEGAYDTLHFTVETTIPMEVTVDYLSPTETQNGGFSSEIVHGMLPYETEHSFEEYVYLTDLKSEKLFDNFSGEDRSWHHWYLREMRQDYYHSFYQFQRSFSENHLYLNKRDYNYNLVWSHKHNFVLRDDHIYTDPLGNTLTFQRIQKESIIDGKRYSSPYELHAFVCYDVMGNIKWVKYINDLIFSVRTVEVVVDNQGKVNWLLRKGDSKGNKTILYSIGMNGNEIDRKESSNYSGYDDDHLGTNDYLITLPTNELFTVTYQSAGTQFGSSQPLPADGFYLTKFGPDGELVVHKPLYYDVYRKGRSVLYEHKLLITDSNNFTRYYDAEGNFIWGVADIVLANDYMYYTRDNLHRAWTYDNEFLGGYDPPLGNTFFYIGNFQEIYEFASIYYGFNDIVTRHFPVATERHSIPEGTEYFEYPVV